MPTIGENIRRIRRANDWTQEELAKRIGMSRSSVAQIERDGYELKLSQIVDIAGKMGVTPADVMDGVYPSVWGDDVANRLHLQNKPELLALYDDFQNRDDLAILFKKSRDLQPDDVEAILNIVQHIREMRGLEK